MNNFRWKFIWASVVSRTNRTQIFLDSAIFKFYVFCSVSNISLFIYLFQISLAVTVLLYVFQMIRSAPCGVKLVTPRNIVEKVSKAGWLLVKRNSYQELRGSLNIPPRLRRSINQTGSRYCRWTTELDENVNREPRYLPKAVCKGCQWYCRPVDYDHRVLVRDCPALETRRERIDVWKWEKVTLPVAFVYDPNHR